MDAMKLASAMSEIDDDLLHEADTAAKKPVITPLYRSLSTLVAAACLVLLFGSVFAFRGPVVKSGLTSDIGVARASTFDQLNIEIEIAEFLRKNLEVSEGTISLISKDGSIIEQETPFRLKGKNQIMWNIAPAQSETYYLTLTGGLITKTLVLKYDESKNEWTIKKKTKKIQ